MQATICLTDIAVMCVPALWSWGEREILISVCGCVVLAVALWASMPRAPQSHNPSVYFLFP